MFYTKMEGIRPRRVAMGLSIGEAADRLGVTRQAWSNWERVVAIPFSGILPDLARVLACTIEELYEEAGDGEDPSVAARQLPFQGSQ